MGKHRCRQAIHSMYFTRSVQCAVCRSGLHRYSEQRMKLNYVHDYTSKRSNDLVGSGADPDISALEASIWDRLCSCSSDLI